MNRRTLLFSIAGIVLGPQVGASTGRHEFKRTLVRDLRRAAGRVIREGQSLSQTLPVVRLCRVVVDACDSSDLPSPALVQGTLDACQRLREQRSNRGRSDSNLRSLVDFEQVGRRFVESVS